MLSLLSRWGNGGMKGSGMPPEAALVQGVGLGPRLSRVPVSDSYSELRGVGVGERRCSLHVGSRFCISA